MKNNCYNTFIFDLDGTLLDTLDDLAAAVNHAMRSFQWPEHSRDAVRRMVGNGVRVLMERATPVGASDALQEAALSAFRSYYMQHSMDATHPYDGIVDMLVALKARGCRTAVVSNKFDAATKQLCAHYFGNLIDVAVGEHEAEGIRKKPAPDTVVEALRCMLATATSILPRLATAICHVSVCCGASATASSLLLMVVRCLPIHRKRFTASDIGHGLTRI